ncbi:MAG: hypothetical protein ACI4JC_08895 [Faecalibacterium sp.]
MTKWQRIKTLFGSLVAFAFVPLLIADPDIGCILIVQVMGIAAALAGLRMMIYYLSMARHMVGGTILLYIGVILFDFGLFSVGIADIPRQYIMLYLMLVHLFSGLVDLLRSMEIRRRELGSWRFKLLIGLGNISLGVLCLLQINSSKMTVYIYCLGVLWSALGRIVSVFRPTSVVYVEQP